MKIIYIIHSEWKSDQVKTLASFDINVELGADKFEIEEGEVYQQLKPYLHKWNIHQSVATVYDNKDIAESKLLVFVGLWTNGYPQPEDVLGYLKLTYNLENYCHDCGIGAVQNNPFRIKKEPLWKNKMLFDLNWVLDEIFVKKEIYESLFSKMGVKSKPVMLFKKDTTIDNTVQLEIPIVDVSLLLQDQPYEVCRACKRKKYNPQIKGFFPKFEKEIDPSLQIFKSNEYFGSGGAADRRIFVTQELYKELLKLKNRPTVWAVR